MCRRGTLIIKTLDIRNHSLENYVKQMKAFIYYILIVKLCKVSTRTWIKCGSIIWQSWHGISWSHHSLSQDDCFRILCCSLSILRRDISGAQTKLCKDLFKNRHYLRVRIFGVVSVSPNYNLYIGLSGIRGLSTYPLNVPALTRQSKVT